MSSEYSVLIDTIVVKNELSNWPIMKIVVQKIPRGVPSKSNVIVKSSLIQSSWIMVKIGFQSKN